MSGTKLKLLIIVPLTAMFFLWLSAWTGSPLAIETKKPHSFPQHSIAKKADEDSLKSRFRRTNSAPVALELWARVEQDEYQWRVEGARRAAGLVADFEIRLNPVSHPSPLEQYAADFERAAQVGQSPDIVWGTNKQLVPWAEASYLMPLDRCISQHAEFQDVLDTVWPLTSWHGQIWGIPHYTDVWLLFFNKLKLKALGWSEDEIATLPGRIAHGDFTLDDLVATAKAAVAKGVVEPGYGYWVRPAQDSELFLPYLAYGGRWYDVQSRKLVVEQQPLTRWFAFKRRLVTENLTLPRLINQPWHNGVVGRSIYHDTVTRGRVLFWGTRTTHWPNWVESYVPDLGGEDYLRQNVGYSQFPADALSRTGVALIDYTYYAITTPAASGEHNQQAACALLAKMMTPEINTRSVLDEDRLGVLRSQADDPAYVQFQFNLDVRSIFAHARPLPPLFSYNTYRDILWTYMFMAENGELPPEAAARAAIAELEEKLGDQLVIIR